MARFSAVREPVVQPQDQSIRHIPLTHNQVAIVDAADFDFLMQWFWHARWVESTKSYYALRTDSKGRKIFLHREIVGLPLGDKRVTDHINHITLDDRRANLRIVSRAENNQNMGIASHNSSGFKGVGFHKQTGKWRAYISVSNHYVHLGLHRTREEAYAAYCEAAKQHYGEFAHF
jgi:hypothetical protein